MVKCHKCPIKAECNALKFRAGPSPEKAEKACPLLWLLGGHLKDLPKGPLEKKG